MAVLQGLRVLEKIIYGSITGVSNGDTKSIDTNEV